ncbi:DNA methyltransferase [Marinicauda salina]|uniref:site-specific DNA-methyltransferase (adenine-specific) n=1 Tax=Marinicauda salina TaxID=2135793 RepID=A0A2U2BRN4_9PROT|nr:type ISP restriction/modification enzyme [Marinicauda salina]PWE16638.1 DNA methyltransferase [Marinicauda salina]
MAADALAEAISTFGASAKVKLDNPAAAGEPEDQLRAPLETLLKDLAPTIGLNAREAALVGESSLADLKTRPDYAVTRRSALIGFIEVKAPGKGAEPNKFADAHDKEQWKKLKSLPNLIYTDGNAFGLYRDGKRERLVHLDGDVRTSGKDLAAPEALIALLADFFTWEPIPPRNAPALAETSARLCRLLREEVREQLAREARALTQLKVDWRKLLFPEATDEQFADGYAQAVTFGLLMAKARGISLADDLDHVAKSLRRTNTLIGSALRLLTEESDEEDTLKTSLATLVRVLDVVDWNAVSKGEPEAWLYFYERFLSVYDNTLRKQTGSYYTPPEVVTAMVRLVDEALKSPGRFGLNKGLASSDVTLADPAAGTGTFLLAILRRIAEIEEADGGPGVVPGAIESALKRLIGFEMQFGPFAVAQLRLLAEIAELTGLDPADPIDAELRLYVADTLADPDEETAWIPSALTPIAESRRAANHIKREEPITVVIGNPPYKEKARDRGAWVEKGSGGDRAILEDWMPPPEWRVGEHAKHLRNLYIYFWRWATWKVFGEADAAAGLSGQDRGVVCYITVAGFLNGPGFQKMRSDLRRDASEIWVIDCSPEGHQPAVGTRIFQGVQQPVCIVLAARPADADASTPAAVRYRVLPEGPREEKFAALADIALDDGGWRACPEEWRAPFLPKGSAAWTGYPALDALFDYDGSGVMPGRTWVIAPDAESLSRRWDRLVSETDPAKKETLFHPHEGGDRSVRKVLTDGLPGHEQRAYSVGADEGGVVAPVRYGFRSFDRQYVIPDKRLINRPNPTLWAAHSDRQVYLTAPHDRTPESGPAVTGCALIPDLHHYAGRGGRVFPLWTDAAASAPNLNARVLAELSTLHGREATAESLFAYIAAVAANPAYTERFAKDLKQPGLRIPLTAERALFDEAAVLGREVVWLHTFGERFADPEAGRPDAPPRIAEGGPTIPKDGAIPTAPGKFPEEMRYDAGARRLFVGEGHIDNVTPEMWTYEVSGVPVLRHWFSYRRKDRSRPVIGDRRPPSPLGEIQPDHWLPEYTSELLNVLHVLGRLIALEPAQAELLERIVEGPTVGVDHLREIGAIDEEA